jgi:hypothetical protein
MSDLLAQLRDQGLEVRAVGAGQLFVGPRSALTEPLRETIRERKADLLRELDLEARHDRVVQYLRQHPEYRRTFDAQNVPVKAEPGDPVSVVLGVRYGEDIITATMHIPRNSWDMHVFLACVDPPAAGSPEAQ